MTRVWEPFLHQARLYRRWDRQLFLQTRFFGAAALTNALLADLLSRPAAWLWLVPSTQELLLGAGARLEVLNCNVAHELAECSLRDDALDARLVMIEQSALEHFLHASQASDATAHAVVMSQLDLLLDLRAWRQLCAFQLNPAACLYEHVLKRVRQELNRRVRFASQSDREHIGRTMMALLSCAPATTTSLSDVH